MGQAVTRVVVAGVLLVVVVAGAVVLAGINVITRETWPEW